MPHLAFQPDQLSSVPILPITEVETSYYLRLRVHDKPGVLADITRVLADGGISIDAMVQKEPSAGEEQGRHHHADPSRDREERRIEAMSGEHRAVAGSFGKITRIRMKSNSWVRTKSLRAAMRYVSTRGRRRAGGGFSDILLGRPWDERGRRSSQYPR